jgi:CubicO group peptidase (beta-lactamase class C family)
VSESALSVLDGWDVPHVAAAVLTPQGAVETHGDVDREFRLASVTKLLTAYTVLVAATGGRVDLGEEATPSGATVRHLLAHTAGYGFESGSPAMSRPGRKRIYSNQGFEVLAAHVERGTGVPFADLLTECVLEPLGMVATRLPGSAAHAAVSTVADLGAFADELAEPALVAPEVLARAVAVQFPGLAGTLPGVGRFEPLDWGLGYERNFGRTGHWAGTAVSGQTFGHFGGAGTFLWVDPVARVTTICLTDRTFGDWAMAAWPPLGDAVITRHASPA